jgi:hypothetical protein
VLYTSPWLSSHTVSLGGVSKDALLCRLGDAGVQLNAHALTLFADARFTTSPAKSTVQVAQVSVASLGFAEGATFDKLVGRAHLTGLVLGPLELGPHLRLALFEQQEGAIGRPPTHGRAPPGAITVASAPLDLEDGVPKGFYLRRIEGTLWLRGYQSWAGHIWSPQDSFAFVVRSVA